MFTCYKMINKYLRVIYKKTSLLFEKTASLTTLLLINVLSMHFIYNFSLNSVSLESIKVFSLSSKLDVTYNICCCVCSLEQGKLFITTQRRAEFSDVFGRDVAARISIPYPIPHAAKVTALYLSKAVGNILHDHNFIFHLLLMTEVFD